MKPFWKCLIISKTLVRTKLKFYPFGVNWGLLSIFGPITPKSKNPHKFNSLNLLMLNETILEMPYCQLNFGKKKKTWNFTFLGSLGADFHIWVHWPKIKKMPQIETLWSSWSVKYLVSPLLPRRKRLWQENLCFLDICLVKFLICAYYASPHSLSLHVVYSIYYFLGFSKYVYLF